MKRGNVEVICGEGLGKTSLALGKGLSALMEHKRVIIIQFLKGCSPKDEQEILERLEPDFKVFRLINIRNGFNFARKVAATGECDVLILDEVLGIIDQNIITLEDVEKLLEAKEEDLNLVMTGKVFPEKLKPYVDAISRIEYIQDLQD